MRSNGDIRDLRLPLNDGERIQILTTRDRSDPDALYVLRHSAAHLLAEAARRLFPGTKVAIGPPIENGFYYDFEFPEPVAEEELERLEEEIRREIVGGPRLRARRDRPRRGARATSSAEGEPYKVELVDTAEGEHLALPAGRLHRPLPRPAPAGREADQGGQAPVARRRLLARRRDQASAHARLRDRVLRPEGPRGAPAPARRGEGARPPPARPRARPRPLRRALAGLADLAPARDGDLERARGPPPARERAPRLRRGEDAAPLRRRALGDLRPLGELPRQHVPDRDRRTRPSA